jgi:hypothetical protein
MWMAHPKPLPIFKKNWIPVSVHGFDYKKSVPKIRVNIKQRFRESYSVIGDGESFDLKLCRDIALG